MLMVLALLSLVLLASPHGISEPTRALRETAGTMRTLREQRRHRIRQAEETIRYADELHVAAQRAERGAQRWLEHWQDSEQHVNATWQAWLDAQARLDRAHTAAAFRTPWTAPTPSEYAARERWLHQAVSVAAERGELPATAVGDALAGRGWDARLHPVEQELVVLRTAAAYLLAEHRRAVATEQATWHDAQLARRTSEDLHREAAAATVLAIPAREIVAAARPQRRTARTTVAVRTA
ncbi:hypothetical protein [Actinoplanes sp. RD1]|uniref:hypothetical protein n=1 Tax=Actinoplanes sp. RD1 TaxID=3064538 RepID=UPI002740AC21|nr:hypothetical protein [Actinoplanes sp. RD1]